MDLLSSPFFWAWPACSMLMHASVLIGVAIERRKPRASVPDGGQLPSATVVVPARDEQGRIERLLASLEAQMDEPFDIVLVDDRSTDTTGATMDAFAERWPGRVRVLHLTQTDPALNPKQHALSLGCAQVQTDIILLTDADCAVPPTWVRDLKQPFLADEVGLVTALVAPEPDGTLFTAFQIFDHTFRFHYVCGATGIGMPAGGFGNNLAVRTSIYQQTGGFGAMGYSIIEDALLVSAVRKVGCRFVSLSEERHRVLTLAQPNLRSYFRQQARWHMGGLFHPDLQTAVTYSILMYFTALSGTFIPFIPLLPDLALWPIVNYATLFSVGAIAVAAPHRPWRERIFVPLGVAMAMVLLTLTTWAGVVAQIRGRRSW